jgi:hypothetical protein
VPFHGKHHGKKKQWLTLDRVEIRLALAERNERRKKHVKNSVVLELHYAEYTSSLAFLAVGGVCFRGVTEESIEIKI